MKLPVIDDDVFGLMEWDSNGWGWERRIGHRYFETSGGSIPRDPPEQASKAPATGARSRKTEVDWFEARMERQGFSPEDLKYGNRETQQQIAALIAKMQQVMIERGEAEVQGVEKDPFALVVDVFGANEPPSDEQRRMWRDFVAGGEAVGREILEAALAMYHRQRAARIHWWKAIYGEGDPLLPRALPVIGSVEELRGYVRPIEFKVHQEMPGGVVLIGISFETAWSGGFGVLVQDGKVVRVGSAEFATKRPRQERVVEDPVFGRVWDDGQEWEGEFRWEAMRAFFNIAEERQYVRKRPPTEMTRGFLPPWEFMDGQFDLSVEVDEEEGPAEEAVAVYRAFTDDLDRSAEQVLRAIYDAYQDTIERYREAIQVPAVVDIIAPRISSIAELKPLMGFQSLRVFRGPEEHFCIGLCFHCSWEGEHGLGVRWRNGRVEEVGSAEVSFR